MVKVGLLLVLSAASGYIRSDSGIVRAKGILHQVGAKFITENHFSQLREIEVREELKKEIHR